MSRAWYVIAFGALGGCLDSGAAVGRERTSAALALSPEVVDFGVVAPGRPVSKDLALTNIGDASLFIESVRFAGPPTFRATIAGRLVQPSVRGAARVVDLDPPLSLGAGATVYVSLAYEGADTAPAEAELVFLTNDPAAPNGTTATLVANRAGPCIRVTPARVELAVSTPGASASSPLAVESCGRVPLHVAEIAIASDVHGAFSVDLAALGPMPLALAPGTSVVVPITYGRPVVPAEGAAVGVLRITSDADPAQLDIDLVGHDPSDPCPTASIEIREGGAVLPQTVLHLDASHSISHAGPITALKWTVEQPPGSRSVFLPNDTDPTPVFAADVAGAYHFHLQVWDPLGTQSCSEAEATVTVAPPDALHIELLWRTPGDLDETDAGDGRGSDLDLHVLHPNAGGHYFDVPFDCFPASCSGLDWGPPGPDGDPRIDRDDTDGAGPESLNVTTPEDGARYRVGANYWNDWGFGPAFVTLRVYVRGALQFHWDDVALMQGDLWDVATIDWPSGVVTPVTAFGGTPVITPSAASEPR